MNYTLKKDILLLTCFLFLLSTINSYSQEKTVPDSIRIQQLEEKLYRKADSLANIIEDNDKDIKELIHYGYENIREDSSRTLSTIQIILTVLAIIIAIIGLVIGFGAPRYIRSKVEEKVKEKVTDDVINKLNELK